MNDKVKAIVGTWVTLAEYKKNENDTYVVSSVITQKIDGKKLKENVFYTLKNGKFTETE